METIIAWLLEMEKRAGILYRQGADFFAKDDTFAAFLNGLAEDEGIHYRVMNRADGFMKEEKEATPSEIRLDKETRATNEALVLRLQYAMHAGTLTRLQLLDCLVKMEFSEWNDLFLYVVARMKDKGVEFQQAASRLQHHKRKVVEFLEEEGTGAHLLDQVRRLPSVWEESILVVEDSEPMARLMEAIFGKNAAVEIAVNGEEALRKANEKHYDVIISDIRMPVMNGIEFYEKLSQRIPDARERFLFHSGNPSSDQIRFFEKNNLRFLEKPAAVSTIRKSVREILDQAH